MPVILPQEAERLWLDPLNETPGVLTALLLPFPAEAMECYPVSGLVNSPKTDTPECILPVEGWQAGATPSERLLP
jgi:putative SOS response-associated peptidase YedK